MLVELDRIAVAARYGAPVIDSFRSVLGAEVVSHDRLPYWSAERTTVRVGSSEVEVLEPDGLGAVADFIGRRGPGLFAVGFASRRPEAFRAHLEARGASFEAHERQLFLTSDKGLDLPGLNIVITPAEERKPAGLLERLSGAAFLHRNAEVGARLVRTLGLRPSSLSDVTGTAPGFRGTSLRLGNGFASHLAMLAPWDASTSIGRFFLRSGPGLYMAAARSEELGSIRERLRPYVRGASAASAGSPLLVPARLLGGVRLWVSSGADSDWENSLAAALLAHSDVAKGDRSVRAGRASRYHPFRGRHVAWS